MYRSLVYAQLYRSVTYCVQIIGLCTAVKISDVLYTDHWFIRDVLCTDHWFMHSCIDHRCIMYRSLVYAQLYRSVMCYVQIIGLCTALYISDVLCTNH